MKHISNCRIEEIPSHIHHLRLISNYFDINWKLQYIRSLHIVCNPIEQIRSLRLSALKCEGVNNTTIHIRSNNVVLYTRRCRNLRIKGDVMRVYDISPHFILQYSEV
jgi:hypothetical protein